MWLNGLSGVVHIKADEIARALANDGYSMAIERLDNLDGLVSAPEQIRPLPSVVKTSDGRIYFATRSSVVWIDPRQIPRNTTRPTVDIQSVNADGKTYDRPKDLRLKANIENLEIRYTAPSLLIPERVRFRYFMEGLDKRWMDAGDRRYSAVFESASRQVHFRSNRLQRRRIMVGKRAYGEHRYSTVIHSEYLVPDPLRISHSLVALVGLCRAFSAGECADSSPDLRASR